MVQGYDARRDRVHRQGTGWGKLGNSRCVMPKSSVGTSPISEALRGLKVDLPIMVRTPVGGPGTGLPLRVAGTKNAGAVLARYAPAAGIMGVVVSVAHAGYCTTNP